MSKLPPSLPERITKEGRTVNSAVSLLSERYTLFQEYVRDTLVYQTHAKKQFQSYNTQLGGFLRPKAQKEMTAKLREFITKQKNNPPPLKDIRREFYSLLRQLTKAIKSIEKQLKKDQLRWTPIHQKFTQDVLENLIKLRKNAEYSESAQLKAIQKYKKTNRYSPAVCEAYIQSWLKRCNEDYIDVTFRDCKALAKAGYDACRALAATDDITERQVNDALAVTREGHAKNNELIAQIQKLQPVK
ncbi:MAG: hypothetical protein ACFFDU_07290 [Candidatus Thorarchaeota archaeon]